MRQGHDHEDKGYAMMLSIVTLLFALAEDARRAAGLPLTQRYRLLWILRPAEAVARQFALEAAWHPDLCDLPSAPGVLTDDSPAAALRLAAFFRAVAFILAARLEQDFPEGAPSGLCTVLPETLGLSLGFTGHAQPAASPPAWPDTS